MDDQEIKALMERYREPAIMLHRPYPPNKLPKTNSWLGGLPALPGGMEWPRNNDDVPLHFLAQIDCSELPPNGGALPDAGILFFFACIDEELAWAYESDQQGNCRVIHAPAAGVAPTPAPGGLPPIMGGWAGYERDFMLPGDAAFNIYPRWPILAHPVQSWPDGSALPRNIWAAAGHEDHSAWREAVNQGREEQSARVATPLSGSSNAQPDPAAEGRPAYLPSEQDPPFPQAWVMVDRIARRIANNVRRTMEMEARRRAAPSDSRDSSRLQPVYDVAVKWVEAAAAKGLDTAPSDEARTLFTDWLKSLSEAGSSLSGISLSTSVRAGMGSAIQFAAESPSVAARIPEPYYTEFRSGLWRVSSIYHQMLGNAKATQEAAPVERDEILLLYLMSDYGVDFMFCDVGEFEFWIKKKDLAARRFDRVRGATAGG
ncbi:MAG: YwqG family protein [Paracoccaceae bacterium]|nr:YwqG family protein [Paracoccaceae bacterium]